MNKHTTIGPFELWSARVIAFLRSALGQHYACEFENITDDDEFSQHSYQPGHVEGIIARLESEIAAAQSIVNTGMNPPASSTINSRKIFVVHGHDNEVNESVPRFLEKLGLEPIILHEQPSSGRTIIEKFESCSGESRLLSFCLRRMVYRSMDLPQITHGHALGKMS